MTYTVLRINNLLVVQQWELKATDLVQATDQRFYPVTAFPELMPLFPQLTPPPVATPTFSDILCDLGKIFLVGVGIYVVIGAVAALLTPQRNDEPLTQKDRKYIRGRDSEICFYCTAYAPSGHVDHRISRANGGGNDYGNLAWACAPCNWSKGAMNDTDFMALFQ
jgi:hypothetical protein